jgi:hypothetical protein
MVQISRVVEELRTDRVTPDAHPDGANGRTRDPRVRGGADSAASSGADSRVTKPKVPRHRMPSKVAAGWSMMIGLFDRAASTISFFESIDRTEKPFAEIFVTRS